MARRIRWGILGLPLAGLLQLAVRATAGNAIDPTIDLRGYAEQVSSTQAQVSLLLFLLAATSLLVGAFSLYAYLATSRAERWALAGLLLLIANLLAGAFLDDSLSMIPAAERYLEGQQNILDGYVLAWDPGNFPLLVSVPFVVAAVLFLVLANICIGIAIWRSGTLPQGAAILWIAAAILSTVATIPGLGLGYLGWAIDALLAALDLGGSGWVAWSIWRQSS